MSSVVLFEFPPESPCIEHGMHAYMHMHMHTCMRACARTHTLTPGGRKVAMCPTLDKVEPTYTTSQQEYETTSAPYLTPTIH